MAAHVLTCICFIYIYIYLYVCAFTHVYVYIFIYTYHFYCVYYHVLSLSYFDFDFSYCHYYHSFISKYSYMSMFPLKTLNILQVQAHKGLFMSKSKMLFQVLPAIFVMTWSEGICWTKKPLQFPREFTSQQRVLKEAQVKTTWSSTKIVLGNLGVVSCFEVSCNQQHFLLLLLVLNILRSKTRYPRISEATFGFVTRCDPVVQTKKSHQQNRKLWHLELVHIMKLSSLPTKVTRPICETWCFMLNLGRDSLFRTVTKYSIWSTN